MWGLGTELRCSATAAPNHRAINTTLTVKHLWSLLKWFTVDGVVVYLPLKELIEATLGSTYL